MSILVSGSFAKKIDDHAIDKLRIGSLKLMERAAEALSKEIEALTKDEKGKSSCILYVCGVGNNGADGLNSAYILKAAGYEQIWVLTIGSREKRTEEFIYHEARLRSEGVVIVRYEDLVADVAKSDIKDTVNSDRTTDMSADDDMTGAVTDDTGRHDDLLGGIIADTDALCVDELTVSKPKGSKLSASAAALAVISGGAPDVIVDCIFGVGLKRKVEGGYRDLISAVNELKACRGTKVISADVPSGLDPDTGADLCETDNENARAESSFKTAVRADVTVTFGYGKLGLYLYNGPIYRGKVIVSDIGYPKDIIESIPHDIYDTIETSDKYINDFKYKLKKRGPNANKGTYGKLLIIAGSKGMSGAAYLSGIASYRAGVGMVRYFGHEANRGILQSLLPEAMYDSYEDMETVKEKLRPAFSWADRYIVGPGLSASEDMMALLKAFAELYNEKKDSSRFLILDADALNLIAGDPKLKASLYSERSIVTPHVGEMARLSGKTISEIKASLPESARAYAIAENVNVILKDAVTITSDVRGRLFINIEGSAALAKAGSGDVLCGVLAGVCSVLKGDIENAVPLGVYLHAMAGRLAGEAVSEHGILAREVADMIPKAYGS